MRLSEAMRLGASMKPQCFGSLYITNSQGWVVATCAIGAVYNAFSKSFCEFPHEIQVFLHRAPCPCPVPDCNSRADGRDLEEVIMHLNDDHKWSRESIADFIEEAYECVEPPPTPTVGESVSVEVEHAFV